MQTSDIAAADLDRKTTFLSDRVKALTAWWTLHLGKSSCPRPDKILTWIDRFGFDSLVYAVNYTRTKLTIERDAGRSMDDLWIQKYTVAAMKRYSEEGHGD